MIRLRNVLRCTRTGHLEPNFVYRRYQFVLKFCSKQKGKKTVVRIMSEIFLKIAIIPNRSTYKVQGKDATFKCTPKAMLTRSVPFAIDNLECDIFVRRSCLETDDAKVGRVGRFQNKLRSFARVNEIGIKYIEFVWSLEEYF